LLFLPNKLQCKCKNFTIVCIFCVWSYGNIFSQCYLFRFFCTKKNNKVTGMTNKTTRSYIMTLVSMYWLNFLKYMFFSDSLMLFECFEFNKDVPITVLFFWIWKMKIATFCRMTHINISNDNILQIQIIWITTTAEIEDNITGQKQFYWLEYKSQFRIIFIYKRKYRNVYTRSLSSDVYSIYKFTRQIF
jgi:hypothetical protein